MQDFEKVNIPWFFFYILFRYEIQIAWNIERLKVRLNFWHKMSLTGVVAESGLLTMQYNNFEFV